MSKTAEMSNSDEMPIRHSLRSSKSMPYLSDTSRSFPYMSEFMTDMYMDLVIKEYNNPEPGTSRDQEYNTSPDTVASQDQEFNTSPKTVRPYFQEHNNPQPSATQDQEFNTNSKLVRPYFLSTETNKLQLLEDVKALQREITLLEEMKKAHTEKSQSTTMRTAVDARILELRRLADPLVEILKEKLAERENLIAGGAVGQWRFDPFVQSPKEKVAESENVGAGETAGNWPFPSEVQSKYQELIGGVMRNRKVWMA